MKKLRINPLVVSDLKGIKDFIAEDNPSAAQETLQEIYKQFENLQTFSYIGTDLSKRVHFKTDYKYITWKNYIIIYKIKTDFIEIYRVLNRFQDFTETHFYPS